MNGCVVTQSVHKVTSEPNPLDFWLLIIQQSPYKMTEYKNKFSISSVPYPGRLDQCKSRTFWGKKPQLPEDCCGSPIWCKGEWPPRPVHVWKPNRQSSSLELGLHSGLGWVVRDKAKWQDLLVLPVCVCRSHTYTIMQCCLAHLSLEQETSQERQCPAPTSGDHQALRRASPLQNDIKQGNREVPLSSLLCRPTSFSRKEDTS